MFTVGQFAELGNVSVRTLHHYDQLGLLKAASIHEQNGYRQYEATQLADLNRILALKDLGFTLVEITDVANQGVSGDELVGMLRLRQAEAARAAQVELDRLERAAARIQLLSEVQELDELNAAVVIKSLKETRIASLSTYVDDYDREFGPILVPMYRALDTEVERLGIDQVGPSLTVTTQQPDGRIRVEAAIPIDADVRLDSETVESRVLPAAKRAATLIYAGDPRHGRSSTQSLTRWLELTRESGFDHYREVNLIVVPDHMAECVFEMQAVLSDEKPEASELGVDRVPTAAALPGAHVTG